MADELIAKGPAWRFDRNVRGLAGVPMLVLTSDDGETAVLRRLDQFVKTAQAGVKRDQP